MFIVVVVYCKDCIVNWIESLVAAGGLQLEYTNPVVHFSFFIAD